MEVLLMSPLEGFGTQEINLGKAGWLEISSLQYKFFNLLKCELHIRFVAFFC
jgi:hypothetical protein